MYLHHWAFQGMEYEFVIPLKNSWDVHSFSFVNPLKTFKVLAECTRGPLVIEVNEKILATLFSINPSYQNTIFPLKNFIFHTLKTIKTNLL
jgi:hypothetical protein